MNDAPEPAAATTRERQRAGIAWALADLESLVARGVIETRVYERLRRDYEERLRWLDAAAVPGAREVAPPVDVVTAGQPAAQAPVNATASVPVLADVSAEAARSKGPEDSPDHVVAATPGWTAPAEAPAGVAAMPPEIPVAETGVGTRQPAREGGYADLWINVTLCLGAFFFVIAALIFVRFSGVALSQAAMAGIMLGFTVAFIVGGLVCLDLPKVRPAGHTFLAVGALLTPLDIIGLYNLVLADRGILSLAATWALGSAYCMAFYGVLAFRRLGLAYGGAAVVAAVSAWGGLIATVDPPRSWVPAIWLVLPLLLLGARWLLARAELGRVAFGPLPAIAAHLLAPVGILVTLASLLGLANRWGAVAALALATLFYATAAWRQPASAGVARVFLTIAAMATGSLLVLVTGYAARVPDRVYPALLLANAWALLGLSVAVSDEQRAIGGTVARRWSVGRKVALAASMAQAALLLAPWGFLVTDRWAAYWTGLFGTLLCYTIILLWELRRPWLLYPIALAAALTLFHALRVGIAVEPVPYAWAFAALAAVPVAVLWLLRRQGLSRGWDWQLVVIGQLIAIPTAALALAGEDRAQLAAILWFFAVAGGAVVAIERREELLVLPNVWALVAVAATLQASGVERRWAEVVYAALGLALALGLQGWRGVPPAQRPGWYMAHRWTAGVWAACGPILAAINLSGPFEQFLVHRELRELVLDYAYGPATLSVTLCGLALGADAIFTLRRPTGYGASAVLAAAVLMMIARITPNNPQAYAVPLGIYLLALSVYVAYERDLGPVRMPAANALLAAAVAVILGTTFLQSLVHPWRYILLGLGEGLVLLAVTLFLRRRYGVALTLLFLVLIALRAVLDAARALPYWAIIGLLGLLLLLGGFFFLLRRDRIEQWTTNAARRWARLM